MNLSKADVARLGRRAQQPVREPGELLAVFVAGAIRNPLNGSLSHAHWTKRARWAKTWRESTQLVVLEAIQASPFGFVPVDKREPKRVTFLVSTARAMDDDNLPATVKPCRDALVDMRIIHADDPKSGHRFEYRQKIDRARRGVEIRIRLRGDA